MDIPLLVQKLTEHGEAPVSFSQKIMADNRVKDTTRTFLTTCGLPQSAAPGLSFGVNQDTLLTVNQRLRLNWADLDDYLVIGSNGSGDPICISIASGDQIVCLNHDNLFEPVFMNSSVWQLCEILLRYRIFYKSLLNPVDQSDFSVRKFSDNEFTQLQVELRQIDEMAMETEAFWQMEISALLWERDHLSG
jgi:hypothetical protein